MIGELCELCDWIRAATSGWRFLFSSSYRIEVTTGWKNESWYYILWDILCGIAGMLCSLLPIVGIAYVCIMFLKQ
jgi:hypothetical protein